MYSCELRSDRIADVTKFRRESNPTIYERWGCQFYKVFDSSLIISIYFDRVWMKCAILVVLRFVKLEAIYQTGVGFQSRKGMS